MVAGPLTFETEDESDRIDVTVQRVEFKQVRDLTPNDAKVEGLDSVEHLMAELRRHYPDLQGDEWVTVVLFAI